MKSFEEYFTNYIVEDLELILCGGGFGGKGGGQGSHLSHPFDDNNLTFGDYKEMVNRALKGELHKEGAWEKTDGQALSVSYKDGRPIYSRNHGHIKNFGQNALDSSGIKQLFKGRGELEEGFSRAVDDLDKTIMSLSEKQRQKIFGNGSKFMALEVIYSKNTNVIPYGTNLLAFHGTFEYDKDANVLGPMNKEDARILQGMIKQINQDIQNTYKIVSIDFLKLPKVVNFEEKKSYFIQQIDKLQKQFKLTDRDEVVQWHIAWWKQFITKKAKELKYNIEPHILDVLVARWALFDKSVMTISKLKKELNSQPNFSAWVDTFDKKDHQDQFKSNILPFELLFLELGMEVMKNMRTFLAVNPKKSTEQMKQKLEKDISDIKKTNDPKALKKLEWHMNRLDKLGGIDAILPTEGLVFIYKDKLYKFVGTFAPINQILGILTYIR